MSHIRTVVAPNPSPMTLDGTRTYIVGKRSMVVIDPGPLHEQHLDAVADQVGDGAVVCVLVTHSHPDHDEAAHELALRFDTIIATPADAEWFDTDDGRLQALATPGHTPDHFAFYLPDEAAVFCGDLMMGGLDTALVARPEGNLQHYLESLDKLKRLQPRVIYPAHGDPIEQPVTAIDRYVEHRMLRVRQVREGMAAGNADAEALVDVIYGTTLTDDLRPYARAAVEAYIDFIRSAH